MRILPRKIERGGSGLVFIILLVLVGGYVGFGIGQLYFDKSSIENEVSVLMDEALVQKRGGVREQVARILDRYEARYKTDQIVIDLNADGTRMSLQAEFERSANLLVTDMPMTFKIYLQREQSRANSVVQGVQDSLENSENNSARQYQKAIQGATQQAPSEP